MTNILHIQYELVFQIHETLNHIAPSLEPSTPAIETDQKGIRVDLAKTSIRTILLQNLKAKRVLNNYEKYNKNGEIIHRRLTIKERKIICRRKY